MVTHGLEPRAIGPAVLQPPAHRDARSMLQCAQGFFERGARESDQTGARRLYSSALFRGDREVVIIHQGQEYRLRVTRADKLILTK